MKVGACAAHGKEKKKGNWFIESQRLAERKKLNRPEPSVLIHLLTDWEWFRLANWFDRVITDLTDWFLMVNDDRVSLERNWAEDWSLDYWTLTSSESSYTRWPGISMSKPREDRKESSGDLKKLRKKKEATRLSLSPLYLFTLFQQSWFILTFYKKVNHERNTKTNKESFKFLITGWNLNSSFVPLAHKVYVSKGWDSFSPAKPRRVKTCLWRRAWSIFNSLTAYRLFSLF